MTVQLEWPFHFITTLLILETWLHFITSVLTELQSLQGMEFLEGLGKKKQLQHNPQVNNLTTGTINPLTAQTSLNIHLHGIFLFYFKFRFTVFPIFFFFFFHPYKFVHINPIIANDLLQIGVKRFFLSFKLERQNSGR